MRPSIFLVVTDAAPLIYLAAGRSLKRDLFSRHDPAVQDAVKEILKAPGT